MERMSSRLMKRWIALVAPAALMECNRRLLRSVIFGIALIAGSIPPISAIACPPDQPDGPVEQIRYEAVDGYVWRINKTKGTRELRPEFGSQVRLIATSKRNCVHEVTKDKTITQHTYRRSAEPTLIAWVNEDNSAWVKGRAWDLERHMRLGASGLEKPKLLFDSTVPKRIPDDPDDPLRPLAIDVAERRVVVLNWDKTVWIWGWNYSGTYSRMIRTDGFYPLFKFPAYVDVMAWDHAIYGRLPDGQITGYGRYHICTDTLGKYQDGVQTQCMFIPNRKDLATRRMWVDESWNGRCWLEFMSGEKADFACDDPDGPLSHDYFRRKKEAARHAAEK